MSIRLTANGRPIGFSRRTVGVVERAGETAQAAAEDVILVARDFETLSEAIEGKGEKPLAALVEGRLNEDEIGRIPVPFVQCYGINGLDHLRTQDIVVVEPRTGFTRTLYRPDSPHNTVFTTERCNSNCVMCSQPPKTANDSWLVEENLRMIDLVVEPPAILGITGGEPTLLGEDLLRILRRIGERFSEAHVHMLTNGRRLANRDFCAELADAAPSKLVLGIPLYADVAHIHDHVVQAKGAFDQTVEGLYNAFEVGLELEVRVVLHRLTIPRLVRLSEFIYRVLPFVGHVALMGLENMGYVRKNWEMLWIDPVDYADALKLAVERLFHRRIPVSIYNLPLCLLDQQLWPFARRSISDYKNDYFEFCDQCDVRANCAGVFTSSLKRHSGSIAPIKLIDSPTCDHVAYASR